MPQRDLAVAGDGSKALAEQGACFHMTEGRSGLGLEFYLRGWETWPGAQLGTTSSAIWTLSGTSGDSLGIFSPFPQLSCVHSWYSPFGSSLSQRSHADLGAVAAFQYHARGEQTRCSCSQQSPAAWFKSRLQPTLPYPSWNEIFLPVHETVAMSKFKISFFLDLWRTQEYRTFPLLLEKYVSPGRVHVCFSV